MNLLYRAETANGGGGVPIQAPPRRHDGSGGSTGLPNLKVAIWFFMGTATLLFFMVFSAFIVRMGDTDWQGLHLPNLLWVNTGLLVLASIGLHAGWHRIRRGDHRGLMVGWYLGGLALVGFVIGQGTAWAQLLEVGIGPAGNPARGFFYLLTGLHAAHVFGGLVGWGLAAKGVATEQYSKTYDLGVELATVYTHFLLGAWVLMLGLFVWSAQA